MSWTRSEITNGMEQEELDTVKQFQARLPKFEGIVVTQALALVADLAETWRMGSSFRGPVGSFGLYAIGGYARDEGERPDIDLLIATDTFERWDHGYRDFHDESFPDALNSNPVPSKVWCMLRDLGLNTVVEGTLPDGYTDGPVDAKTMLRAQPSKAGQKPVDIVIVDGSRTEPPLSDLDTFERIVDVNQEVQPLARLPLLRLGVVQSEFYWD